MQQVPLDSSKAEATANTKPIPCRQGTPPTKDEATDLLARVSMYAPLDSLTGPALVLEQQWLALESTGWPPEAGTWVSHGWFEIDIASGPELTYVIRLQHGISLKEEDRFLVVCNDGGWQLKQYARGAEGEWMDSAHELPGQRGELTSQLVTALVAVAGKSRGPWFAQVATGNALAWERAVEMYQSRSLKPPSMPWGRLTWKEWAFRAVDATHVEAGSPESPSMSLRLEKVEGLWKIENFTEGREWVPAPPDMKLDKPGTVFDPPFGLIMGKADAKAVEKYLGTPDSTRTTDSGTVLSYTYRQIEVTLDLQGKVSALSMKTGAPFSGVRVGSPVSLWELVYGPQADPVKRAYDQLRYVARDGKIVEVKALPGGK